MKCNYCKRELPNKDLKLDNKCIWCEPFAHVKGKGNMKGFKLSRKNYNSIKKTLKEKGYLK